jgi:hypothetical protein
MQMGQVGCVQYIMYGKRRSPRDMLVCTAAFMRLI